MRERPDVNALIERELTRSLQSFRDEVSRATAALKPEHSRRGILGSGAAAKDVWHRIWQPALSSLPERVVGVALEAYGAYGARLTPEAAATISAQIDHLVDQLGLGLRRESASVFPQAHFAAEILELLPRLKIQARLALDSRAQFAAVRGEGQLDALVEARTRAAFDEDIAQAIAAGNPFSLLFMDLDNFKHLNDTHGHNAGNDALQRFALRAAAVLGDRATLYRIGGDEFVALALSAGPNEALSILRDIELEITAEAITPYPVPVGVSTGIASWPEDGTSAAELEGYADSAMYVRKRRKKARQPYYIRELNPTIRKLASEQLDGWELRVFAKVLAEEVSLHASLPLDEERTRPKIGSSAATIQTREQLRAWLLEHFDRVSSFAPDLEKLINTRLPHAMGLEGAHGDCRAIVDIAKRVADVHRRAILSILELRDLAADPRFHSALQAAERLVEDVILQLGSFSDRLEALLAAPKEAREEGRLTKPTELTLVIAVPPDALAAFRSEMEALHEPEQP